MLLTPVNPGRRLLIANPPLYKPTSHRPYENLKTFFVVGCSSSVSASALFAEGKPKLTLDEFFNSVSYNSVAISPDGNSVVIATERADWDQKIFRHDLWLYRDQLNQNDAKAHRQTHQR